MKKDILKYTIPALFAFAILFTGCEEMVLDDRGVVSAETFYTDANTLEPAVVGIYARMHRATWQLDHIAPYYGADDLTSRTGSNKAPVLEADQFFRTAGNSWVDNMYNGYYNVIVHCNSFIAGASKLDGVVDEAVLNDALANARFVRGMLYFRLATAFKDVAMPLVPEVDLGLTRTPYREVMEQSIEDLKYAEQWLVSPRDSDPTSGYPFASQTAAKALMAKAYMQLTGYPTNETDKWDEVKRLSKEIIDDGVYSLMDDYAANFQNPTQINKEIIFAHMCTRGSGATQAHSRYYGFKWGNWGDCFMEVKYFNNFPDGYRKKFSAVGPIDTINTDLLTNYFRPLVANWNHPMVSKFSYGTIRGMAGFEHVWQTSNDCPVMRTAEVYLMYAEACARAGETAEATKYLNYVKRRAYAQGLTTQADVLALPSGFWMTADPAIDYTAADGDLVDAIVDERGYEFVGEPGGNRWLDLLRLEKVAEANAHRVEGHSEFVPSQEVPMLGDPANKELWWTPIPGTEIEFNPNL